MVAWGHRIKCRVLDLYSLEMVACGRRGIVQVLDPPPLFSETVACGHRDLGQVKGSDENHLIIQNRT